MSQKDILKEWFKEIPQEQAPSDFTQKVMKVVMSEWRLNPIKYQPIISKKAWWMIGNYSLFDYQLTFRIALIFTRDTRFDKSDANALWN